MVNYSVSTKTKPNTFQHSVIKPQLNALTFGTASLPMPMRVCHYLRSVHTW